MTRKLVEQRLAACVNVVKGVESVYEWKGKIEHDSESLLIMKSNVTKSQELVKFVQDHHPYDCPEVVTMQVGSPRQTWCCFRMSSKSLFQTSY